MTLSIDEFIKTPTQRRKGRYTLGAYELTAEEAKEYGFTVAPDWKIRIEPPPSPKGITLKEAKPTTTLISPAGWEFKDLVYDEGGKPIDYTVLTPEGQKYTKQELDIKRTEEEEETRQRQETLASFEPFKTAKGYDIRKARQAGISEDIIAKFFGEIKPTQPSELETNLRKVYPEMFAPEASYGFTEEEKPQMVLETLWGQIEENPQEFLQQLASKGRTSESEAILKTFFEATPEDIARLYTEVPTSQVTQPYTELPNLLQKALPLLTERNVDKMMDYYSARPDILRSDLITAGRNPNTETLIKTLYPEITDRGIQDYFSKEARIVETEFERAQKAKLGMKGTFVAGVGDLVANVGGIFKWLGKEGIGEKITKAGQFMQAQAAPVPFEPQEFTWNQLFNPQFYMTYGVRMLPNLMVLAAPAIGAYGLAGKLALGVAGRAGLGAFGTKVITAFGTGVIGAGLSRPIESAMEAAQTYDESRNQGLSHLEASEAAKKVFIGNLKLAGWDAMQIATAFMPTPTRVAGSLLSRGLIKTAQIGGKLFITGLSEGGEEVYQQILQNKARGDDRQVAEMMKDPDMQLVFSLGAVAGLGMGGGADILMRISDGVVNKLNAEQKATFDEDKAGFVSQGFAEDVATKMALDKVAETKEVANIIEDITKAIDQWTTASQIKTDNKADALAVQHLLQQMMDRSGVRPEDIGITQEQIQNIGKPEKIKPTPEVIPTKPVTPAPTPTTKAVKGIAPVTPEVTIATRDKFLQDQALSRNKILIDEEIKKAGNREVGMKVAADRLEKQVDPRTGVVNPENIKDAKLIREATIPQPAIPKAEVGMPEAVEKAWDEANIAGREALAKKAGVVPDKVWGYEKIEGDFFADLPLGVQQKLKGVAPAMPEEVEKPYTLSRKRQTELNKIAKEKAEFIDKQDIADVKTAYSEGDIARLEDIGIESPELSGWIADAVADLEAEAGRRFMEARPKAITPPAEVAPEVVPPVAEKVAPPPPEGAVKRVFDRIQIEPAETGFTEKIRQGYHKFQVKMVDDLYAIKKFTEAYTKGGVELSIEENPYLLARLLRGIAGKANVFIEYGTFGKKIPTKIKGKVQYTGESLENILREVKEPRAWQDFSTYLVARRSFELAGRNIKTGITMDDALAAVEELDTKYKNFDSLAKRVYKYQDNLLVYGQEMGLLSEDLLGKLRKYGNYVPFYRVFNELQAKGFMGKKMADIASPIKRIKGSERELLNPLESIIKNTYVMISAADRNQVGIMMGNLVDKNPELAEMFERVKVPMARVARISAKELGVEIEGLSEEDAEAVVDIFRPSFFVRGDEVTVLIDGKKAYFKVDPNLRDALLNLDRESIGIIGKFLSYPAKWLRAGATLSPDFMVRNPARDALTAFCFSNYNFIPGVDFLRGVAGIIRKDADYQLFHASGAEHSMMVSMDREYLHKTFKEVVEGKKFTAYMKHPLELFQIASALMEKATRLGEFKAGIRRGATPLEAGYSARAVTLDFAQAGTTAHAVNRLAAFFNAQIRGLARPISSFREHPTRTAVKIFLGITLPSILLYYANRDDDRWKEIPQWQKDLFWIILLKPLPDNWKDMTAKEKSDYFSLLNQFESGVYRFPKPFELGILFGSVPERFLEWLDHKDPKLMKDVLLQLLESGSPNPLPTAVMPIIEWMSNYSFFRGTKIVPASREKMPPELQYTAWTSEVSKHLGELLNLPPAKIDNVINGWTGGLGRYAVDILDVILKKTGISPDIPEPSPELADIPALRAFVVRNPYGSSGEAVESFYDVLEKYEQGEKYLQEMLKLGEQDKFDKYKAAHPELIFLFKLSEDPKKENIHYSASARYLRRVARDLSELGKKQDLVYKDKDISSTEKRRLIDEIDFLKTDVARKALDLLMGKEPQLLQDSLNESIKRLGEVIEEEPVLSLEKPDIFDMRKLRTDFGNKLEATTKEDLDKLTNIDPLAYAYLEVKGIEKTIDPIVNKKIYEIKPDLKEGVTFEDYYKAWQSGIVKDEVLSNLTRRQVELLRKYHGLDKAGQKQFLIDNPELAINPRTEWLRTHPFENAQLAVWGQATLLTREAYNQFLGLVKSLDIPDNAIPPLILPSETSIDTHFAYEDMVSEGKHGSWEAQLLLKKDAIKAKDAKVQAYADWAGLTLSDTPIASLEIKTKPEFRGIYDKIGNFSDKESPDYIADEKARAEAIKNLKTPEYIDNTRRIEVIEKGTDEIPIDKELVNAHVEYGKLIDQEGIGSGSAEVMLYRVDNPDYNAFRVDVNIWGDNALSPIDESRVPIWRIDVQYKEQDKEYQAILDKYPTAQSKEQTKATQDYLSKNPEYKVARIQRDGYILGLKDITKWTEYNQLPTNGFWRDRYRKENPDFDTEVKKLQGKNRWADIEPNKIPSIQYDQIYEQFKDLFEQYENVQGTDTQRSKARQGIFNQNPAFKEAYYRRNAYGLFFPDKFVENYVVYNMMPDKGWDRERYLKENRSFYSTIYGLLKWTEPIDFDKVPSKEVEDLYNKYLNLPSGTLRENFRYNNSDLERWLLLTGKVTTSVKESKTLTASERASLARAKERAGIEEKLGELEK